MIHDMTPAFSDVDDLIFRDEAWNCSERLEQRGSHAGRRGIFLFGVNWTALAERSPVMIDGLYRQGAGLAFQLDAALKSSVKSVKKVNKSAALL